MTRHAAFHAAGCSICTPMNTPTFQPFGKMSRLFRDMVVQEKIDGTNATVAIFKLTDDMPTPPEAISIAGGLAILAGSRTRWITPQDDNFGFAAWVAEHADELRTLGPGWHRGEWWGLGIQRNYGLTERRWSLFNTTRWCLHDQSPQRIETQDPRIEKYQDVLPPCCHLVPVLYEGPFRTPMVFQCLQSLEVKGSAAARNFAKPEGVVVYHTAGNVAFKVTLGNDGHKGVKA